MQLMNNPILLMTFFLKSGVNEYFNEKFDHTSKLVV